LEKGRITFHDPCQIVRRGGVAAQPVRLLKSVLENYVEMSEQGHMNWCCGGGGGVSTIERSADLRLKVFHKKKTQLDELNVETIVTACANCRIVMEDGLEHYGMDIPLIGMTELIAEHLVPQTGMK
jgi:Fe-S oxidoreductase